MEKVVPKSKLAEFVRGLKKENKKLVLAGGCFDLLHPGHVVFLTKAKKEGDILIVILESDKKVKKLKGDKRPIHSQKERAKSLSLLKAVDYIVLLSYMKLDAEYDELIGKIRPDVIAATSGGNAFHHQRMAKMLGAKLKFVTKTIGNYSTSRILSS